MWMADRGAAGTVAPRVGLRALVTAGVLLLSATVPAAPAVAQTATGVLRAEAGDGAIEVVDDAHGPRAFLDTLEALPDGSGTLVNELGIDDYVAGVAEMPGRWHLEALKAQAVAARSYTMTSLDRSARYDLCATEDCQVYRGVEAEHPRTDSAIAATAGVVVTYDGRTARTYYHADSGGTVASSSEVWGTWSPYLLVRQDARSSSPHRSWAVRLDGAALGASLSTAGLAVGEVVSLRVVGLSESGRVDELEVVGSTGSRVVRGTRLTNLARSWGLKSMAFRVQGGLTVTGDGWGHGVGMSQYGARALANSGYDFGQILAFYYPNTGLTRFVASGP